ncbi:esterase/lipase family protein [Desulfovibrio inopinatus]|uniref:esterase/lipase family protein n=1 Tax=Desulfovibrio inopinatus TaxID=102109 RepID=UPI0003F61A71|nr:alpha/beta fold hydrolase [Desulfovibrio inopinatus]
MVFTVFWLILLLACFVTLTSTMFLFADLLTRSPDDTPQGFRGIAHVSGILTVAMVTCFIGHTVAFFSVPFGYLPWRLRTIKGRKLSGVPVVFVHGLYHSSAAWFAFRFRIGTIGRRPTFALTYPSFFQNIDTICSRLEDTIETALKETEQKHVILVGHSLGGLVIRRYLTTSQQAHAVAGIVTLGTPHRGSILAHLATGHLGRSIAPDGALIKKLEQHPLPNIPKMCLYSCIDNMVVPGKNLIPRDSGWVIEATAPVSHTFMLIYPPVIRRVRQLLDALDPVA